MLGRWVKLYVDDGDKTVDKSELVKILLMSEADKETLMAIMHHVSAFRPDWAQKIKYFLQEQGWEIE